MVSGLMAWLSGSMGGTPALALAGAFGWGVLSVLLSPCHLAGVPLVVGFIGGRGKTSAGKAFALAASFACGILVTVGLIGLVTGMLGRMLGDVGGWVNWPVALVFFAVGLHLLGVLPLPFDGGGGKGAGSAGRGAGAAFILGLVFGSVLGPCTFAYMAPVLGVVFSTASADLVFAVSLVLAYAAGHSLVIALAGTFTGAVQGYLDWHGRSKAAMLVKKTCGVLVIAAGVYLLIAQR